MYVYMYLHIYMYIFFFGGRAVSYTNIYIYICIYSYIRRKRCIRMYVYIYTHILVEYIQSHLFTSMYSLSHTHTLSHSLSLPLSQQVRAADKHGGAGGSGRGSDARSWDQTRVFQIWLHTKLCHSRHPGRECAGRSGSFFFPLLSMMASYNNLAFTSSRARISGRSGSFRYFFPISFPPKYGSMKIWILPLMTCRAKFKFSWISPQNSNFLEFRPRIQIFLNFALEFLNFAHLAHVILGESGPEFLVLEKQMYV